ncbi:ABC transporter permease [Bernardetia sp.]|uniref:ABC transporter permease n=1 Tax=Bernardetia sp. TaxID=1937974 RepID=UPI0025BE86CF|nr:ABC transporter permease [Bernardetia sp.]
MASEFEHISPSSQIRKRLLSHKPAMFGLIVILFAIFIALAGHTIMPDKTPDANDGAIQISKQMPIFETKILKFRKRLETQHAGFFESIYNGDETDYIITPIDTFRIVGDTVFYKVYGKKQEEEAFSLIYATKPVFTGHSNLLSDDSLHYNYQIKGDTVRYVDIQKRIRTTTLFELKEEFQKENIETRTYWLGTDRLGRDILSRLMYGTRISLMIGTIAVLISLALGVTLGALSGYFDGWIDNAIHWFMTVVWSIPSIMLVIAITIVLQSKGVWVAFVAVGLTMWVEIARIVRGKIKAIKRKPFIEATHAFGMSHWRIIFRHILPNMLGEIVVVTTSNFAAAILIEAGLSFLGLGVKPPTPSWGMMVSEGYSVIGTSNSWHLIVFPSLCISLLVLAFNLLGNGLRDAYDPNTNHG